MKSTIDKIKASLDRKVTLEINIRQCEQAVGRPNTLRRVVIHNHDGSVIHVDIGQEFIWSAVEKQLATDKKELLHINSVIEKMGALFSEVDHA